MTNNSALSELKSTLLEPGRRILITVHMDPDFDAIGSALAMSLMLDTHNIDNCIWIADKLNERYNFLPKLDQITRIMPKDFDYNLILSLDCAHLNRIKDYEKLDATIPIVNIDHHVDNTRYGNLNIIWTISSVGEQLATIFKELDWDITKDIATCLYAAISFDTGQFRYSNVGSKTHRITADLLEFDIDHDQISYTIFEDKSEAYFGLCKVAIDNLYINKEKKFAITKIPNCPAQQGHDIIEFIRQMGVAEVVIVCREMGKNKIKVSLRSRGDFSVSEFAHQFDGGGHHKAAGIRFFKPLDDVVKELVSTLEE